MSKVITFSRVFPSYHPRKGEPTRFIEKIYASLTDTVPDFKIPNDANKFWDWHEYYNATPKYHTIRAGHRWKVGDKFSPRVWSGKPYNSKQITIAPDIEVKKVWDFDIDENGICSLNKKYILEYEDGSMNDMEKLIAENDGLTDIDFFHWLIFPVYKSAKPFDGQIICWNENINY